MVLVIFRNRLRPEHAHEYQRHAAEMDRLVRTIPGFIAVKRFTADDGERVTIGEFETMDAVKAWREHPAHREAQRMGRATYYAEYRLQVAETARDYAFQHDPQSA